MYQEEKIPSSELNHPQEITNFPQQPLHDTLHDTLKFEPKLQNSFEFLLCHCRAIYTILISQLACVSTIIIVLVLIGRSFYFKNILILWPCNYLVNVCMTLPAGRVPYLHLVFAPMALLFLCLTKSY